MRAAHDWFRSPSPAGPVFVAHDAGRVTGLFLDRSDSNGTGGWDAFVAYMREHADVGLADHPRAEPGWAAEVAYALAEGRTDVDVDLSSLNSDFYRAVLRITAQIPKGEVRTYGQLAAEAGRPRAARAVGQAMARNPVPLLVPCHRVVPSGGKIGNYGYGAEVKRMLLKREGVTVG